MVSAQKTPLHIPYLTTTKIVLKFCHSLEAGAVPQVLESSLWQVVLHFTDPHRLCGVEEGLQGGVATARIELILVRAVAVQAV